MYYFWLGAHSAEAERDRRFLKMLNDIADQCDEGAEVIVHGDGSVTRNEWKFYGPEGFRDGCH